MQHVFGLIGKTLSHSFSKEYFELKFLELKLKDHSYKNFELDNIEGFSLVVQGNPHLKGLNVTIPYKESIIPFLDELTPDAKEIGAVNCIEFRDKKLIGHNTDHYGFKQSIKPFLEPQHERALILGTGGSSKAVAYALESVGVEVYYVSTSKKGPKIFSYEQLNGYMFESFKLIINTTPVGMFPDVHECPAIPYQYLTEQHLCYDLIYNPTETLFLETSKKHGAVTMNGLSMLKLQAEKSWIIWNT
ncbi:MAG: Shikimate dehydrogenase [Bacteroidetes bacterium]|jgi:shikimate dehydrogenase|nr:Shikimate dehydrogenase [Bacteroidota bacterium]